ncbi:MAG: uracil phosphoribosyltransferase [Rickettsiales bacterium]|nr:uracil phosphoribosyltransferase [Rickettsiales bacterium]
MLNIVKHPLISHHLSIIRDKKTNSEQFRNSVKKLSNILSVEATKNLLLEEINIFTPICETKVEQIKNDVDVFVVPILRAGLGISETLYDLLPFARVQHLGMYRNEKTLEPVWYYNKLPQNFKNTSNTFVYICDPMLATGGSAYEAIKLYVDRKVPEKNITFLNLISAPEGVEKIQNAFPNINIFTCSLDEKLNEKGYIVPGLGDAGDRIFNTI